MLVYSGTDILEIRPQQILESKIPIKHPYLSLIKDPKPTKKRVDIAIVISIKYRYVVQA